MPRSTGWSVLAEKALEIAVLAFACRAMEKRAPSHAFSPQPPELPQMPPAPAQTPVAAPEFLREYADPQAQYYRAADDRIEVLVAMYSDGRIRIAGSSDALRFAGLVQNERGDVLEIGSNNWSKVYVRPAPDGTMQLELQGGAYDAHVLTCEPIERTVFDR